MPSARRSQSDIAQHLMDSATAYAHERGYRLGDGAASLMQATMDKAARRISYRAGRMASAQLSVLGQRERAEVEAQLLAQAERQTHTLIDAMIESSRIIPNYAAERPGIIGEQTYDGALSLICPLWPFC
jgi:hypothetical protein